MLWSLDAEWQKIKGLQNRYLPTTQGLNSATAHSISWDKIFCINQKLTWKTDRLDGELLTQDLQLQSSEAAWDISAARTFW